MNCPPAPLARSFTACGMRRGIGAAAGGMKPKACMGARPLDIGAWGRRRPRGLRTSILAVLTYGGKRLEPNGTVQWRGKHSPCTACPRTVHHAGLFGEIHDHDHSP